MTPRLLNDAFAPITWRIGFLGVAIDRAAEGLMTWRGDLNLRPQREDYSESLADALARLEPLVGGARPRELLVECGADWTAYFDNQLQGTDPVSAIGYLSQRLGCIGVAIASVSASDSLGEVQKMAARSFELFGAANTSFLNYVRSVASVHDGDRWEFAAAGTPQPFEDLDAYKARRVQDRLTPALVQRYCQAVVGVDVFDAASYGPRVVLVHTEAIVARDAKVMSLADARRYYGLARAFFS
jgi:hypothetical protein